MIKLRSDSRSDYVYSTAYKAREEAQLVCRHRKHGQHLDKVMCLSGNVDELEFLYPYPSN